MMSSADAVKIDLSNEGVASPNENDGGWFPVAHQLLPARAEVAREWMGRRRAGLRSWRLFFQTSKFHLPPNPALLTKRLATNIDHFQSNYLCVFLVLLVYCVVTSPLLLVALAACLAMLYVIRTKYSIQPLRLGALELNPPVLYCLVAICSFPLFFIAGAGSIIFWVIGASFFVVFLHAALYMSETVPGAEFDMENV